VNEIQHKLNFNRVDRMMRAALGQGIFPGAVLTVRFRGKIVFHQAYGFADLFSRRKMNRETIFDLASLTKPLATALVVMWMVQHGRMELDQPIAAYCPELYRTDKGALTVRQMISHRSGLPAWRPYYLRLRQLPENERMSLLRQWLLSEKLLGQPGSRVEYSDLGFILLQWILESVAGENMACFLHNIYGPLGLNRLFYIDPHNALPATNFAATELCPWRNRLVVGTVHDDNAHVLGGIAGHAGLFGSAGDVAELLQGLLNSVQGFSAHPVFDQKIIRTFFKRQADDTWALGFDTPSDQGSSAGRQFSRDSVGHLGYTGTSFWMDCKKEVIAVLLTNRVHPSRYNTRIKAFRPGLHDAILSAVFCR
jgi:CubicO group peptidase (beta-lactamase class C family)